MYANPLLLQGGGDYLDAAAPQRADGITLHADTKLFVSAVPAGATVSASDPTRTLTWKIKPEIDRSALKGTCHPIQPSAGSYVIVPFQSDHVAPS